MSKRVLQILTIAIVTFGIAEKEAFAAKIYPGNYKQHCQKCTGSPTSNFTCQCYDNDYDLKYTTIPACVGTVKGNKCSGKWYDGKCLGKVKASDGLLECINS